MNVLSGRRQLSGQKSRYFARGGLRAIGREPSESTAIVLSNTFLAEARLPKVAKRGRQTLLDAANIVEKERIDIWKINNGERGGRMISLNGSAARRAQLGDPVIFAAFAMIDEAERKAGWKPDLVFLDENDRIKGSRDYAPVQQWT